MGGIIIALLLLFATVLFYFKYIKNSNPEAYIKINFIDFKKNNFYDTFSLYFDKKKAVKNRKIKEKYLIINVFNFRKREIMKGKLIIINSSNNEQKEFSIKIYKNYTNVINIKINNSKNSYSSADIIFYTNDFQKQIKLNYYLEYNNYNTNKRKRLLIYNCEKEDIISIINDNSNDTILNNKAEKVIEKNKNKLLLINFYMSPQKTNILVFIDEEKPLIIPTKKEKDFFTNFYVNIHSKRYENSEVIKSICKNYKDSLVKGQTLFGKNIMNLDDNKSIINYISFINQGINYILENNIISKNNEADYFFILGYMLLFAYISNVKNYKNFLSNFCSNLENAWKKRCSYVDLMKIGVSLTFFWINNLEDLSFQYVDENSKDYTYNKGFQFFKNIINDLKENSDLSFIYLQINSGSGFDLINEKQCYKMSMISVEDIKSHIIENIPKYYFIYSSNKNIYITTDPRTQVMCFNERILFNHNTANDDIMNVTLGMFHECGHAKFYKNIEIGADHSPKHCINKSFDFVEKLHYNNKERGESGKFVDYFLYNSSEDASIIIISSKSSNELMDKNLFIDKLDNLNVFVGRIIGNNSNINVTSNTSSSLGFLTDTKEDVERYEFLEKIGAYICY